MQDNRPIINERTLTYKNHQITLTWQADAFGDFGGFYGWRVGDKEVQPHFRHANLCFDEARQHVDELVFQTATVDLYCPRCHAWYVVTALEFQASSGKFVCTIHSARLRPERRPL